MKKLYLLCMVMLAPYALMMAEETSQPDVTTSAGGSDSTNGVEENSDTTGSSDRKILPAPFFSLPSGPIEYDEEVYVDSNWEWLEPDPFDEYRHDPEGFRWSENIGDIYIRVDGGDWCNYRRLKGEMSDILYSPRVLLSPRYTTTAHEYEAYQSYGWNKSYQDSPITKVSYYYQAMSDDVLYINRSSFTNYRLVAYQYDNFVWNHYPDYDGTSCGFPLYFTNGYLTNEEIKHGKREIEAIRANCKVDIIGTQSSHNYKDDTVLLCYFSTDSPIDINCLDSYKYVVINMKDPSDMPAVATVPDRTWFELKDTELEGAKYILVKSLVSNGEIENFQIRYKSKDIMEPSYFGMDEITLVPDTKHFENTVISQKDTYCFTSSFPNTLWNKEGNWEILGIKVDNYDGLVNCFLSKHTPFEDGCKPSDCGDDEIIRVTPNGKWVYFNESGAEGLRFFLIQDLSIRYKFPATAVHILYSGKSSVCEHEECNDQRVRYYDLHGLEVHEENLTPGLYFKVDKAGTTKMLIK